MNNNITLSIAIPTFNGSRTVSAAIESALSQAIKLGDSRCFEIVISDNCSNDGTSEVCRIYADKHPDLISYFRNETNVGYDRNIDLIFSRARGVFVKILCDDDELMDFGLARLFDATRNFPLAGVFVTNFDVYNSEMTKVLHSTPIGDAGDRLYEDTEEFLTKVKARYGQTSSLMFRRESWLSTPSENAFETMHIQVYKVLHVLQKYSGVIMPEPLLKVRHGSPNFNTSVINMVNVPLKAVVLLQDFCILYPNPVYKKLLRNQKDYVINIIDGIRRDYSISEKLEQIYRQLKS